MFVADVDAAFEKAVKAGAEVTMPLADMFWGDRYGRLTDPFGHCWSIATHQEDVTRKKSVNVPRVRSVNLWHRQPTEYGS